MSDNLKRFQVDDISSGEHFGAPNPAGTPERNLLMAVLERAILDFVGNDKKDLNQAEEWIFAPRNNDDFPPFSFGWVCKELDLDPERISNVIKQMPKRGARRVAPWYFEKHSKEQIN